jgi:carbonic anhydrase
MTGLSKGIAKVSRRKFVRGAGGFGLLAGLGAAGIATPGAADAASGPPGPAEALRLLMEGNERWVRGKPDHPRQSAAWRYDVAAHQEPIAAVVSCIDSRVPPEIVFDRGLGDLFVIRTGAQTIDDQVVLGSIEFGPVNYASVKLLFILGHQRCGAVSAAIPAIESGEPAPGHIQAVADALRPAYQVAKRQSGDLPDNMVRAQTKLTVQRLRQDPLLSELIASGRLMAAGGYYSLDTGAVEIIA